MTSSFTTNKGFEQPAPGDYVNAWATPVNNNWDAIDNSLGGTSEINVTATAGPIITLQESQYQPPNIEIFGTLAVNLNYQLPTGVGGMWSISNTTTGNFTVTFSIAAGNAIVLNQGRQLIVSDGATLEPDARSPWIGSSPIRGPSGQRK